MARVESVQLVDDLDGGAAEETVPFSLEGSRWEIDLTAAHAARLRAALAPFIAAARRSSAGSSPASPAVPATTRRTSAEIRRWAVANGFELSGRGRIPSAVVQAYEGRSTAGAPETDRSETAVPAPAPEKQAPVDLSGLFREASVR